MDNREESREYFTQVLNLEPGHTMAQVQIGVLDALESSEDDSNIKKNDRSISNQRYVYLSIESLH